MYSAVCSKYLRAYSFFQFVCSFAGSYICEHDMHTSDEAHSFVRFARSFVQSFGSLRFTEWHKHIPNSRSSRSNEHIVQEATKREHSTEHSTAFYQSSEAEFSAI